MSIISISKLNKYYSDNHILKDISFSLNKGDKLALIGKNGAGKTTLLKVLIGEENYESGSIHISPDISISYMTQNLDMPLETTILSYCMSAFEDIQKQEQILEKLEIQMSEFDVMSPKFESFINDYNKKIEEFENMGGFLFKSKVKGVLNGLGFDEDEHMRTLEELSGGQVNRLNLARLIASEPSLLLLDEPTNHLDMNSISWLETYLKNYDKTVVLISHDRFFLDIVANKTLEIEAGKGIMYNGNYSEFKIKKEDLIKANKNEYEKQQANIKKQEDLIRIYKQRGTEKLAKRAKSREKMLERIEKIELLENDTRTINLRLKINRNSGNDVLFIKNISKSFEKPVLKSVSLNIYRNQKIGLIGANGSGKSTLLKIIMGELDADFGEIKTGHNVDIAYYEQNLMSLNENNTILNEIVEYKPSFDDEEARTFLGALSFSNDDVFKQIKVLSGGEKARVMLAKLLLTNANTLLLDEPTNHLDIYSKEILEEALKSYRGTIVVVSHDRYFINSICNHISEIQDGVITNYTGNYDDFIYMKNKLNLDAPSSENTAISKDKEYRINQREEYRTRQREQEKTKRELKKTEEEIHIIEQNLSVLQKEMCIPENYEDHVKAIELQEMENQKQSELDALYRKWEELSNILYDDP